MKKLTITCIALFALSGCTNTLQTRPVAELKARNEAMFRGRVKLIAPDSAVQELIAAHEEKFGETSFAEAHKGKKFAIVNWVEKFGHEDRGGLFVDKSLQLQEGDIIDFIPSRAKPFVSKADIETVPGKDVFGLCTGPAFAFWYPCHFQGLPQPVPETPSIVLGIVCRAGEPGCEVNSSPGTTIGMGRQLLDPADYRGVEAESQQPMTSNYATLAELWGIPYCMDCEESDQVTVADPDAE